VAVRGEARAHSPAQTDGRGPWRSMPPATFDPLNLRCGVLADVAQPVEQRFRKLPRSIQPAITKNQTKRRIDGRQAPIPSPRTPVPLYAYAARSRREFFWLSQLAAKHGVPNNKAHLIQGTLRDASTKICR